MTTRQVGAGVDATSTRPGMLRVFLTVWFGQTVSVVGSGVAAFALGVWVYQKTGSVTQFALILVLTSAPMVFLVPFAGALVDRWDRRRTMIAANLVSAAGVLALFALVATDRMAIWHIYLATALTAAATAFHWPAYAAASTLLVPKRHFARAAGLTEFSRAASVVLSPLLASVLLFAAGLRGVLVIDCASFLCAAACLVGIRIPSPEPQPRQSLMADVRFGWRYLAERPGLGRLLAQFSAMNLLCSFVPVLVIPLVLAATSEQYLGLTVTLGAVGFLVGGVIMSIWGGPPHRARAIVLCGLAQGVGMLLAGLRPWPVLIAIGLFCFYFWIPILNGCSQAIWQSKVPPGLQGRIFAIRRMFAQGTTPMGYLLAGPLADRVFVPLLLPAGALASSAGQVIGVGPGRGVGLLFVVLGVLCLAVNLISLRSHSLMHVERDLPDAIQDN